MTATFNRLGQANARGVVTETSSDRSIVLDSKRTEANGTFTGCMIRVRHGGAEFVTVVRTNIWTGKLILAFALPWALSVGDEYSVGNLAAEVSSTSCSLRLDSRVRWSARIQPGDDYGWGAFSEAAEDPQIDFVRLVGLVQNQRLLSPADPGGEWGCHSMAVSPAGAVYCIFGDSGVDAPDLRMRLRRIDADGAIGVFDQELVVTNTPNGSVPVHAVVFADGTLGAVWPKDNSGMKFYYARFSADGATKLSEHEIIAVNSPLVLNRFNLTNSGDRVHLVYGTSEAGVGHTLFALSWNKDGSGTSSLAEILDIDAPGGIGSIGAAVSGNFLIVAFSEYDAALDRRLVLARLDIVGGAVLEDTLTASYLTDVLDPLHFFDLECVVLNQELAMLTWNVAGIDLEYGEALLADFHGLGVVMSGTTLPLNVSAQSTRGAVRGALDATGNLAVVFGVIDDTPAVGDVSTYYGRFRVEDANGTFREAMQKRAFLGG